jgi:cyanophycinase
MVGPRRLRFAGIMLALAAFWSAPVPMVPVQAAPMAAPLTVTRLPAVLGTLVIAGGGALPTSVFAAFLKAAGGKGTRIAVFPVASGQPTEAIAGVARALSDLGAEIVPVHLETRAAAADPALIGKLRGCGGYWFTGGDQNRIGDLVVDTPLHAMLNERYRGGAVIGGTSAGAAAMSRIMLTGKGDLSDVAPGTYETRAGLGFLDGCIVDQHFLRRQRQNRLISLMLEHPDRLGIGVDEETALVVQAGMAAVVGNRRVLVFDPLQAKRQGGSIWDMRLHLLEPGQSLNLTTHRPQ